MTAVAEPIRLELSIQQPKRHLPPWVRALVKNPISIAGLVLVTFFALLAIFAPLLAPPPPNSDNDSLIPRDGFVSDPAPPSAAHRFGTTEGQYDIFYGVVW